MWLRPVCAASVSAVAAPHTRPGAVYVELQTKLSKRTQKFCNHGKGLLLVESAYVSRHEIGMPMQRSYGRSSLL